MSAPWDEEYVYLSGTCPHCGKEYDELQFLALRERLLGECPEDDCGMDIDIWPDF